MCVALLDTHKGSTMAKGHKNAQHQYNSLKLDDREYRVFCAECMNEFYATRSDAVYCSAKCRTHATRAPQRLANCLEFLDGLSYTMGQYFKQYKRNRRVYEAMQRLHKRIGNLLSEFEIEVTSQE